ncbi:MAG: glycosyltransferase [candidate division WOR-3 bacterium]
MATPSSIGGRLSVAYITACAPFGKRETFIIEEMLALLNLGVDLTIVPRNPPPKVFHKEAETLLPLTINLPLLNWEILTYFLKSITKDPLISKLIRINFSHSRNLKIALKNLAVFPKAVFLAALLKKKGINHIHTHWGSTTATIGWIIAKLTHIPYSITLHRWDINENNLLEVKVASSAFVRCIAEDGRRDLLALISEKYQEKVKVIHIGVNLQPTAQSREQEADRRFVIACPGDFIPKKGQKFLIEAIGILKSQGWGNIHCLLIGEGPMEKELRRQVAKLGLENSITFVRFLPHSELMAMLKKGAIDAVIMPSIVTPDGDKEGIPVTLMEAMAFGVPVISTKTGGIMELVSQGSGILVPEKSAEALVGAILRLITDPPESRRLSDEGRKRIAEEFEIGKIANTLLQWFRG